MTSLPGVPNPLPPEPAKAAAAAPPLPPVHAYFGDGSAPVTTNLFPMAREQHTSGGIQKQQPVSAAVPIEAANQPFHAMPVKRTSNYVGVHWHRGAAKWVAQISIDCKRTHLGYFTTELEAARCYDKKALTLGRPLNFPFGDDTPAGAAVTQAQKAPNSIVVGPCAEFTKGPYKKRGGLYAQRQKKVEQMEAGSSSSSSQHASVEEITSIPGPYKAPSAAVPAVTPAGTARGPASAVSSDLNFSQFDPYRITGAIHLQHSNMQYSMQPSNMQGHGRFSQQEHPMFKYRGDFNNGSMPDSGDTKTAGQAELQLNPGVTDYTSFDPEEPASPEDNPLNDQDPLDENQSKKRSKHGT